MNNKINVKIFFLLFLICACSNSLYAQSIPPLKKGERIIFIGNSMTHGGHYRSFMWLYYMTRLPNKPITIINTGVGGESTWDIKDRLDYDIFDRRPTYVALTFGTGDIGYDIFWKENAKELSEQRIEKPLESFRKIERRLLAENEMTKMLIGGSPYDETTKLNGLFFLHKNGAILKIVDAQRGAVKKNGQGFMDFNQPMVQVSLEEQKRDSTSTFCRVDRTHPDNDGQMATAYLFLKAQELARVEVSDVSIDANNKSLLSHGNCKVSKLKKEAGGLGFDYLANSLPYPLDPIPRHSWGSKRSQRDVMDLMPLMKEFSQKHLQMTNLEKGYYRLTIDESFIDSVSSRQLEGGINLIDYPNAPQYQRAMRITYLNEERFEVEKRFREYLRTEYSFLKKEGLLFAGNKKAINKPREYLSKDGFLRMSYEWYIKAMHPEICEAWSRCMKIIVDTIYKMNRPATHRAELTKVG